MIDLPSDEVMTQYVQQHFALYPEKFGLVGSYSRDLMQVAVSEDPVGYTLDHLMIRLTTAVLSGRTISENPQVKIPLPKSWWQHLKYALQGKINRLIVRWEGNDPDTGEHTTPPPWMVLLWPLLVLFPRWLKRYPVLFTEVTADIHFEQRILYPEIDAPAQLGRPVIYETLDVNFSPFSPWGSNVDNNWDRFLNRHEIVREIISDPASSYPDAFSSPHGVLLWLEHHGVNVDQLVKRR